jgi:dTDP-4-amino-4,6-dideoxygalactose transaminase
VNLAIPLVDLAVRGEELDATDEAVRRVLRRGWFVLGPEVEAFEAALAESCSRRCAVTVGSGTDALILGLLGLGVGPGDEVVVPALTAFPTAAAVLQVGATPVLVDVEEARPVLDLGATLDALTDRTRAVILVHLYGVAADAPAFAAALAGRGVVLVEDCAQAQGATLPDGRPVGAAGRFGAFSFYPTKNLGALGDGGAVVTDDEELAGEVRAWRSHGERGARYRHELPARNSRLDDLQAAVLALRLAGLPAAVERRRRISRRYEAALGERAAYVAHGAGGAPHLAVIRSGDREGLAAALGADGVGTGVHYPFALHEQPALRAAARPASGENAAAWARTCLSLPLYPSLADEQVDAVIEAVAPRVAPWR